MSTVKTLSKSFKVRQPHQELTFSDHVKLRCYQRGINPNIVRRILVDYPLCSYKKRTIAIHWKLQAEMGKKHRFLVVVLKFNNVATCYFRNQFELNLQRITNVFHGETVADTEKLEKSRDNLKKMVVMAEKEKVLYPDNGVPSKKKDKKSGKRRTTIVPAENPKTESK